MSFRDLEYVVAVADLLHFGKAAAACSVSQPTLSGQIRKLESYLGIELFERASRSVLVTARGEAIVTQARVILAEGRKLYDIAHEGATPLSRPYRLGIITTLSPYITQLLLQPLRDRFPLLLPLFTEGLPHHLFESLERGDLDAVIASSPVRHAELSELPLFDEDLVLSVARDHRLATVPQVRLSDLDPEELILLSEGHCLRTQVLELFGERGPRNGPHSLMQAAELESLRHMVGSGAGFSLIPRLAVQVGVVLDDMVAYRMIREVPPRRSLSLFHRSSFGRIQDTRLLRDLIRDTMHALGTVTVHGREPRPRSAAQR